MVDIIGGKISTCTSNQLGENFIFTVIETLVTASILCGYIFFLFNPEENAHKSLLLIMIGIVFGFISSSMPIYTLALQLHSSFFHGLCTCFIAFCLSDVFTLLKDSAHEKAP
ncbi:DUF3938 domain-containing protein [Bacillus sp. S1-R2T1-FB]|uniref:DUF3938 domain-containing protein n=1 Tax=Bacillus sp. S1-R2T1-FB TaxID=1973493 RepID=UPI0021008047|nr:DUF3938 domain-containing protein [Bacillus sp. S1-R2T1-FB]